VILLSNREVVFGQFPNMETNLNYNKIAFTTRSEVILKYESDQDLMNLFILKKYMDDCFKINDFRLTILYTPYSRMDRRNSTYTFNLKYICDFINKLDFEHVTVYDAHSEVTTALLNRCTDLTNIPTLFQVFAKEQGTENLSVFYPDAGAQKRNAGSICYPTLIGFKARDFASGNITNYEIHGLVKPGSTVVIIDDLCSKGGTFIGAAKALKAAGAGDIFLIVGHCENTIHTGDIFKTNLINKVYTTNSILSDWPKFLIGSRMYVHELYEKEAYK